MLVEHGLELQDRERSDRQLGPISLGDCRPHINLYHRNNESFTVKTKMLLKDCFSKTQETQICFQVKKDRDFEETDQEIHLKRQGYLRPL